MVQRNFDYVCFGTVFFPRVIGNCEINKNTNDHRFEIELKDVAKIHFARNRIAIDST